MPHCANCQHQWKRKNVWKLALAKHGRTCPNCGQTQHVAFKDDGVLAGLGSVSVTISLLLILFFPFYIRLSNKETNLL